MTSPRVHRALKGRTVLYLTVILCVISIFYLYQAYQQSSESSKQLHHKCLAEQASLSSQLQAVIEYKGRLEQSLTAEEQALVALRSQEQKEKDALKNRISTLQDLFDSLTLECNKVEKSAQEEQILLHQYKDSLAEIQSTMNLKLENLKKENLQLRERNLQLQRHSAAVVQQSHYPKVKENHKNISKQIEVTHGVYNVIIDSSNIIRDKNLKELKQETNIKEPIIENGPVHLQIGDLNQIAPLKTSNQSIPLPDIPKTNNNKQRPVVPNGFAPELFVHDNDKHKTINKNNGNRQQLVEKQFPDGVKPPNRYEAKLFHGLVDEKNTGNLDSDKKINNALERLSPPLEENFHNPLNIGNNHDAFQEINNNNLPAETMAKKQLRANINDNADFNDVNISLDQNEPAMPNNLEEEDDENEDYDNNKMDFQGVNRN